ncbi:FAD-dependent oxidoreductase [Gloeothece verrucosa]|uniref:FAD dependent oxidoreductase n=1 Tax=Gloeothece verrucosa (strain PCC 7822) TaxID=497965 RepID=E0U7Y9_GLOV7|nr:FAD-dependent oxidoreductase [Gloeothece verrucosa]ADN16076.1 FAD dependent oxidoreductase [Gloeothece verrucosa PCC 7822]
MKKNDIRRFIRLNTFSRLTLPIILLSQSILPATALNKNHIKPDETVNCEILIVGGGLAGVASAYESLLAGRTVCLTEITDWVGGQITSQGTSALDEGEKQRSLNYFPRGYQILRSGIERLYGQLNPGNCWVSHSCFIPKDAQQILFQELQWAARQGNGQLKWFPSTVVKELEISADGDQINGVMAIQHTPKPGQPPINSFPLSKIYQDAYRYEDSPQLSKKVIHFVPKTPLRKGPADWYVIEATETGEVIALADVPYRLGLDPRSALNPSSPTDTSNPYCTQGFTYTFAMEQTKTPVFQEEPPFYAKYKAYYGYDPNPSKANFDYVFTYRRIWNPTPGKLMQFGGVKFTEPMPGDISMQNWEWGNDYRPGTSLDNLIYSRQQLQETGQLKSGNWMGGLRQETLRKGEEHALGYYYWLVEGTTDSQLGDGVKKPYPNHILLKGLDSPMGTLHGLSKYPYIREARRIIGRFSGDYPDGFAINELDISAKDYFNIHYRDAIPMSMYYDVWRQVTRLEIFTKGVQPISQMQYTRRTSATPFADGVGITQYSMDFHPCMANSPPEAPGNREREDVRWGYAPTYPAQIPLRAMIPQKIDNLLVAGKTIATSHIAAAAFRVQSFEWAVGAAAGTTADFALKKGIFPYQLVEDNSEHSSDLLELRQKLENNGNPTHFPEYELGRK